MTLRDIEDFGRNPHEDTEIHTVQRSIRNHEGRHAESPFQKNGDPESRAGDDAVQLCVQCQKAVQFHKRQYERTGKILTAGRHTWRGISEGKAEQEEIRKNGKQKGCQN